MQFIYTDFLSLMEALSQQQDTINFWFQFVLYDCLGLYTTLQYHNLDVRNGSIPFSLKIYIFFDIFFYMPILYLSLCSSYIQSFRAFPCSNMKLHTVLCMLSSNKKLTYAGEKKTSQK